MNINWAEQQAQYLIRHVETPMEQAEIRLMQSTMYNFQGQLGKAIQYAIMGLQLLKLHVPEVPNLPLLIKEMIAVKGGLFGKK